MIWFWNNYDGSGTGVSNFPESVNHILRSVAHELGALLDPNKFLTLRVYKYQYFPYPNKQRNGSDGIDLFFEVDKGIDIQLSLTIEGKWDMDMSLKDQGECHKSYTIHKIPFEELVGKIKDGYFFLTGEKNGGS